MQFKLFFFSTLLGMLQVSAAAPTSEIAARAGEKDPRWVLIGGSTCVPKCVESDDESAPA